MPSHILTHVCYIFMVAVTPIFLVIARTAHRQENPALRRVLLLDAAGYLSLGAGGILRWLQPQQGAVADTGHILMLLGCIVMVYNAIFFFTIPKGQRRLNIEPSRMSAIFVYKFKRA